MKRPVKLLDRLRGLPAATPGDAPYRAVVAIARRPNWYTAGAVPDTLDGRFDMVALVLSLLLVRLEAEGERTRQLSVNITESFIADMEGNLREIGIGDLVVGKHVGKVVGALGGRLGAYRDALSPGADPALLEAALTRNLYRGASVEANALAWTVGEARALAAHFAAASLADIIDGRF